VRGCGGGHPRSRRITTNGSSRWRWYQKTLLLFEWGEAVGCRCVSIVSLIDCVHNVCSYRCVCRRGGGQERLPAAGKPGDLRAAQHVRQHRSHLLFRILISKLSAGCCAARDKQSGSSMCGHGTRPRHERRRAAEPTPILFLFVSEVWCSADLSPGGLLARRKQTQTGDLHGP
jgi:hypothetical protein